MRLRQAFDAGQLAGIDGVAQFGDGLVAREAAPPGQHHAARGRLAACRVHDGQVTHGGIVAAGRGGLGVGAWIESGPLGGGVESRR